MSIAIKTFEVAVDNDRAALAFDMRGAVIDFLRGKIVQTMERAEDAEIDRDTALRRFALTYSGAAKGYRLPRTVPASIVRWVMALVMNAGREGFPVAPTGTVGTFSKEALTKLPGNLLMVKLGGVIFVGELAGGIPTDLGEVRVHKQVNGTYLATLICGRSEGESDGVDDPVEGEDVDA